MQFVNIIVGPLVQIGLVSCSRESFISSGKLAYLSSNCNWPGAKAHFYNFNLTSSNI